MHYGLKFDFSLESDVSNEEIDRILDYIKDVRDLIMHHGGMKNGSTIKIEFSIIPQVYAVLSRCPYVMYIEIVGLYLNLGMDEVVKYKDTPPEYLKKVIWTKPIQRKAIEDLLNLSKQRYFLS